MSKKYEKAEWDEKSISMLNIISKTEWHFFTATFPPKEPKI